MNCRQTKAEFIRELLEFAFGDMGNCYSVMRSHTPRNMKFLLCLRPVVMRVDQNDMAIQTKK